MTTHLHILSHTHHTSGSQTKILYIKHAHSTYAKASFSTLPTLSHTFSKKRESEGKGRRPTESPPCKVVGRMIWMLKSKMGTESDLIENSFQRLPGNQIFWARKKRQDLWLCFLKCLSSTFSKMQAGFQKAYYRKAHRQTNSGKQLAVQWYQTMVDRK